MSGLRTKCISEKHHGENPLSVAADAAQKSTDAVKEVEAAAPGIAPDAKPEYERVVNDMRAIQPPDGVLQREGAGRSAGDALRL